MSKTTVQDAIKFNRANPDAIIAAGELVDKVSVWKEGRRGKRCPATNSHSHSRYNKCKQHVLRQI